MKRIWRNSVKLAGAMLLLSGVFVCLAHIIPQGRMTGGGSVFTSNGVRVTHGFELYCDATKVPNNLEINWGPGNQFHLETLTAAICIDTGNSPRPPQAPFDMYVGFGTGRCNGTPGVAAEWVFTDRGEPGTIDTAEIIISPTGSCPGLVVDAFTPLTFGNHQAHVDTTPSP